MMTLQEKNEVLRKELDRINYIVARNICNSFASTEEQYASNACALREIAKEIANVMRHDLFGDEPPKKSWVASEVVRTLKMPVISMPGKAAIKYHVDDPELPRLAAAIETVKSDSGKVSCDCTLYAGNEVIADMQVYRGKSFALAMTRRALKGAMSRFGKRRRMSANRQSREAAKKEGR